MVVGPHGKNTLSVLSYPDQGLPFISEVEWHAYKRAGEHDHLECQILVVLQGGFILEVHERKFPMLPGAVCILPPGLRHTVHQEREAPHARFLDIRVTDEEVSPYRMLMPLLGEQLVWQIGARDAENIAASYRGALEKGGAEGTALTLSTLWRFAGLLVQGPQGKAGHQRERLPADRRLALAEGCLRDRLAETLSVDDVAAYAGLSRSQLTRLFEKHHHTSPAAYLRQLRVDRACKLLKTSTLTIKEVAFACGFVCSHHFHRVFRTQMKRSPRVYRGY